MFFYDYKNMKFDCNFDRPTTKRERVLGTTLLAVWFMSIIWRLRHEFVAFVLVLVVGCLLFALLRFLFLEYLLPIGRIKTSEPFFPQLKDVFLKK